jgi:Protein of Unknown function (DUF2784)
MLASGVMVLHFAFLLYVIFGGFLAWRWPRAIVPHLVAAGWGAAIILFNLDCPLTHLEDYFRARAGEPALQPSGFIDTYIEGVLYPQQYIDLARALAAAMVAVSWFGLILRARRRRAAGVPSA